MKGGQSFLKKVGRAVAQTAKDTKVLSNLANKIPKVGNVASAVLRSQGLGRKRRGGGFLSAINKAIPVVNTVAGLLGGRGRARRGGGIISGLLGSFGLGKKGNGIPNADTRSLPRI